MRADTILALAIVGAAAAWLAWRAVRQWRARKDRGPDCANCGH